MVMLHQLLTKWDRERADRLYSGRQEVVYKMRTDFIIDVATLDGRSFASIHAMLKKLHAIVDMHPNEFVSNVHAQLDGLLADAAAQRITGESR